MNENTVIDPTTGEEVEVIDIKLYALNLAEDGRILSATEDQYGAPGQPRVETLPTGATEAEKDISNYKYMDGKCIYDPLPQPEPELAEPNAEEDLQAMAVDHEYRLTLLELGLTE